MKWTATIAMCALALAGTAIETPTMAASSSHEWKLVAGEQNGLRFIDLKSVVVSGVSRTYWELTVPDKKESPAKIGTYTLIHWRSDCARQSLRPLVAEIYTTDSSPRTVAGSGEITTPPESIGERELLFVCRRSDKYPTVPPVASIDDAIHYTSDNHGDAATPILTETQIDQMAAAINTAMAAQGMTGVIDQIQTCYSRNEYPVAYCVTMDVVARSLDQAFGAQFQKNKSASSPPVMPYFEDAKFLARVRSHLVDVPSREGEPIKVVQGYSDKVERRILDHQGSGS